MFIDSFYIANYTCVWIKKRKKGIVMGKAYKQRLILCMQTAILAVIAIALILHPLFITRHGESLISDVELRKYLKDGDIVSAGDDGQIVRFFTSENEVFIVKNIDRKQCLEYTATYDIPVEAQKTNDFIFWVIYVFALIMPIIVGIKVGRAKIRKSKT